MPNGNIIVEAGGEYNRFDGGAHRHKFNKIKRHYVVGCETASRMLSSEEIRRLAPTFVKTLGSRLGRTDKSMQGLSIREWRSVAHYHNPKVIMYLRQTTFYFKNAI